MKTYRFITLIMITVIGGLLISSCIPTTETAVVTATKEIKPTDTVEPTNTATAVAEPTHSIIPPTETIESISISKPVSFQERVENISCGSESPVDNMALSEVTENTVNILNSMDSFQFRTIYQFTQNEQFIPDQLALEIEGKYSGLKPDANFWMDPISFNYQRSHTKVSDLQSQIQNETIITEDLTWVKLTNDAGWIEQAADEEVFRGQIHNLPEVLGPFYLLNSFGFQDSYLIGHSEKLDVNGETITHRCWRPDPTFNEVILEYPKVSGPFILLWHWDQLYTFLEEPEVHIWLNENETQLLGMSVTGKQVGNLFFDWEIGVVEHEPPNDFMYWVEITDVDQPLNIQSPPADQIALIIPTQTDGSMENTTQDFSQFPTPNDAVKLSDPLLEEGIVGDISALKPPEFWGPAESITYFWMSKHISAAWHEMPYEDRPVYESLQSLPSLFYFYTNTLQEQGWQLESAQFQLGKPVYHLLFSKGTQTLPIILEDYGTKPAQIWAFLPQDKSSPDTTIMHLTQYDDFDFSWIFDTEIDHLDSVWVSSREGATVYDGSEWTKHLNNISVSNLATDPQGNVWAYTEQGFKTFDGETWIVPDDIAQVTFEYGLEDFTFDQDGKLWAVVANDMYHVAVFDNGEWRFFTSDSFVDCNISLVYADSQGRIWFGKNDEKSTVYYIDGNDWYQVIEDQTTPLDVQECENEINCSSFQSCQTSGEVNNIVEDSKGHIWVGYEDGLKYFDGQSWTILDTDIDNFPFKYVDEMTIDQFDRIWVLSNSEALHMLNETGSWQSFFPEPGLSLGSTEELNIDSQGNIWLTGGLIFKFEPQKVLEG